MDIGSELRSARERAALSLEDLFSRTRIPLRHLRSIEQNDFSSVPPGIFVRSFIRTYAREVGLDPVPLIVEYRAMTEPVVETAADLKTDAVSEREQPAGLFWRPQALDPNVLTSRPGLGYALIAIALLIVVIGVNRYLAGDGAEVSAAETTVKRAPSPNAIPAVTSTGSASQAGSATESAAEAVSTTGSAVQIDVHAEGLCWIRAVADDQTILARLLQPGERHSITAQRDIVIRVGDPAAISYSVNGQPGRPLGSAGVPVTVRVGPDGKISASA